MSTHPETNKTTVGLYLSPPQPRQPKRPIEPTKPKKEFLKQERVIFDLYDGDELSYDQMDFADMVLDSWPVRSRLSFEMMYDEDGDEYYMRFCFKKESEDPDYEKKLEDYNQKMKEYEEKMSLFEVELKQYNEDLNKWQEDMNKFRIDKLKRSIRDMQEKIRMLET